MKTVKVYWPEKIRLARLIMLNNPTLQCFSSIFMKLIPVESDKVDTFASDKYFRFYYNPKYVEKATIPDIIFGIMHEIGHIFGYHFDRLKKYAKRKLIFITPNGPQKVSLGNVGGDIEIHLRLFDLFSDKKLLQEIGADQNFAANLKKLYLHHELFSLPKNLYAEEYCEHLWNNTKDYEGPDFDDDEEDDGESIPTNDTGDSDAKPSKLNDNDDEGDNEKNNGNNYKEKYINLNKDNKIKTCGSSADDIKKDFELDEDSVTTNGKKVPKISEIEAKEYCREVAERLKEKLEKGNIPGSWNIWVDAHLRKPSKTNYLNLGIKNLRNILTTNRTGMSDFSYRKQNKRSYSDSIILPSWIDTEYNILIAVDTSGSMADDKIGTIVKSELDKIIKTFEYVDVIECDADIQSVHYKVRHISKLKFKGGGGTSTIPIYDWIKNQRKKYHALIIITDGYTDWPKEEQEINTIVVIPNKKPASEPIPSWIKHVIELKINELD